MTLFCLLLLAAPLVPESAPIGTAAERPRDPLRDPLPADPVLAQEIRLGYRIFLDTPRYAPRFTYSKLSCGSCHLNAGQKLGALPLAGVAAGFPEYNKRSGRMFTIEDRVVG